MMSYRDSADHLIAIGRDLKTIEDAFREIAAVSVRSDEQALGALHEARRASARLHKAFERLCDRAESAT